jgi:hypothetical protein
LQNTLTLAVDLKGPRVTDALLMTGLEIHILGGNDFYSQRITVRPWHLPAHLVEILDSIFFPR